MSKPTPIPTLRSLAIDHIEALAAELRKSDRNLTREQAIAKAASSPEGLEARRLYNRAGSHLPYPEAIAAIVKAELAKVTGAGTARAAILEKRQQVAKVSGSGPLDSLIEDPKISGPKAPADTLPAQPPVGNANPRIQPKVLPSDAILAAMHEQAQATFPDLTPAQSFVQFMSTDDGAALHRRWQTAHAAEAARS